ncbi:MAG: HigA family addiction module antidote protein [Victivallales bacterium]|nr:HigA family addiction module antidote protein [Victivallales bacterium]
MEELKISITDFAEDIGVSRKAIPAIVNRHKSITAETTIRIGKATGTSPQLWMNLQNNYGFGRLTHEKKNIFSKIKPIAAMFV